MSCRCPSILLFFVESFHVGFFLFEIKLQLKSSKFGFAMF